MVIANKHNVTSLIYFLDVASVHWKIVAFCAHQGVYSTSNLIYHEVYFPPSCLFFQYKQKRKRPKEIVLKHGFRQWLFIYTVLLAKGEIVSVQLISWH